MFKEGGGGREKEAEEEEEKKRTRRMRKKKKESKYSIPEPWHNIKALKFMKIKLKKREKKFTRKHTLEITSASFPKSGKINKLPM